MIHEILSSCSIVLGYYRRTYIPLLYCTARGRVLSELVLSKDGISPVSVQSLDIISQLTSGQIVRHKNRRLILLLQVGGSFNRLYCITLPSSVLHVLYYSPTLHVVLNK